MKILNSFTLPGHDSFGRKQTENQKGHDDGFANHCYIFVKCIAGSAPV